MVNTMKTKNLTNKVSMHYADSSKQLRVRRKT